MKTNWWICNIEWFETKNFVTMMWQIRDVCGVGSGLCLASSGTKPIEMMTCVHF